MPLVLPPGLHPSARTPLTAQVAVMVGHSKELVAALPRPRLALGRGKLVQPQALEGKRNVGGQLVGGRSLQGSGAR